MATKSSTVTGGTASVTFDDNNDWGAGFTGGITIANRSGTATNGWTIAFDLSSNITNIWGAEIVSHTGTRYVVRNLSWDAVIAANGSVSFGFQADGGNPVLPSSYVLNGATIGGGGSGSSGGGTTTPAPLPTLSVGDAAVTEDSSATKPMTFTVKLSSASQSPVTVAYRTSDGSAHAGTDYDAAQGTVTFEAGQTTQTVQVATHRGAAGTESFTLLLSSPSGATVQQGQATGTITNPVPAPLPVIQPQGATVHEAAPSTPSGGMSTGTQAGAGNLLPAGFLSTKGNQVVDANGNAVKIAAVNWFGMETGTYAPHGLGVQGYKTMMDQMVRLGFNAVRLPFSLQLFDAGSAPNSIDYGKNPDLQGLNGLGIMDKVVAYAGQVGLKVILDDHRSAAGGGPNGNGLWYDSGYTEAQWLSTWKMLAQHYAGNATVIGGDLSNEPHGAATWGDGGVNDWAAAATRGGNAVQSVNPNWLVFVEGIENYGGDHDWWGGNLMGVRDHPVTLGQPNKVVYSPHDYPSSVYGQPWFNASNYPNNLPDVWNKYWGYIYEAGTAPVWIGEFGTKLESASDQQWLTELVKYMDGDLGGSGGPAVGAGQQGISWAYWSWNPDSGDTGGILKDDWSTVDQAKVSAIQPAEYHTGGSGTGTGTGSGTGSGTTSAPDMQFTVTLSAASGQAVSVHYATADGTAHAGTDYQATSGDLVFAPGETVKLVTAHLLNPAGATGQIQFLVNFSSPSGATLGSSSVTGTIVHDGTTGPSAGSSGSGSGSSSGTGSSTGSGSSSSGTSSASGETVSLQVNSDWGTGMTAAVTVANGGDASVHGWQVKLTTKDVITNLWNGTTLSHNGDDYLVGPASFNADVAGHSSVQFGFQATEAAAGAPVVAQLVPTG